MATKSVNQRCYMDCKINLHTEKQRNTSPQTTPVCLPLILYTSKSNARCREMARPRMRGPLTQSRRCACVATRLSGSVSELRARVL
ncbi:hypothetical protein EON65_12410 [archaeon]|nr:MAG: hypothetical protein EON65_12410 [archaeon]